MDAIAATFKIVVLGEGKFTTIRTISSNCSIILARVGKTSLTVRFCQNKFDD